MPRQVTEDEKRTRRSAGSLLDEVMLESAISLRALAAAVDGDGDRRGMLRAFRNRTRTMTADSAVAVGDALNRVGLPWMSASVMLYAAGYFAGWIRYLNCLRVQSYPAALVAAFVTHSVGDRMARAFGRPAVNGPGPNDDFFHVIFIGAPRSALSRLDHGWLYAASASWHAGEQFDAAVEVASALDRGTTLNFQIRNAMAVSLAINVVSQPRDANEIAHREVAEALYEAYHRRLPLLYRQEYLTAANRMKNWDLNVDLNVGELDAILDRHLPAARYFIGET